MNRYAEMQVFVRAAEDGSFSAAARNLALTPSAVSKLIARLEDRLGVLLFRRSHRTIDLTPEGEAFCEAFYHAAQAAIEAVDTADAAVFCGTRRPSRPCGFVRCPSLVKPCLHRKSRNFVGSIRISALSSSCASTRATSSMTAWASLFMSAT